MSDQEQISLSAAALVVPLDCTAAMNAVERETAAGSSWPLFDLVGSGVAVTTPDGTLEYCNTALLQLLAQDAKALLGSSIFHLLDGGANNELESLHRIALATNKELRTQVRSSSSRFVASAVLRRLDSQDGLRVIWSFVDARYNEPAPPGAAQREDLRA
jgi:nitrogen-specific signal transduction histidine kinase